MHNVDLEVIFKILVSTFQPLARFNDPYRWSYLDPGQREKASRGSGVAVTGKMTVPTLILIGQLDDLTPPKDCQGLASENPLGVSRSGPKDKNIRLIVLPGSYHAFDNTSFPKGQYFLGSHWLEYNSDARKRSVSEIKQFLRDNLGD
jgi:dienelactone hydrolase